MIGKINPLSILLAFLMVVSCQTITTVPVYAQMNFLGKPGLMTIPSAEWIIERPLGLSFSYIPKEYSKSINPGANTARGDNTLNFYSVRAGLTDFLEVNFSLTYRPRIKEDIGIGDRQVDFRFKLLQESKWRPQIVLGVTPPGSVAPFMAQDYLVMTKNLRSKHDLSYQVILGYGSPFYIKKNRQKEGFLNQLELARKRDFYNAQYLTGFFYGGRVAYKNWGGAMVEYNTNTWNFGGYVNIGNTWHFQVYSFEGNHLAFGAAAAFKLDGKPKELRAYD
ncbi:YjbH domain-containing protein [Echinicola marina]|uniref:YjbH domain-containing protein n=1 Tax=Echinicola marina TaxID=2859768 RepID=UPI001CF651FB|nr:YjbH domain-containing protein [Echinicola marina]UCS93972.1 YjbH domain-containing protein [Echinicola marina]